MGIALLWVTISREFNESDLLHVIKRFEWNFDLVDSSLKQISNYEFLFLKLRSTAGLYDHTPRPS